MNYDYRKLYQRNTEFLTARPALKKIVFFCNQCLPYLFGIAYAYLFYHVAFRINPALPPEHLVKIFCIPAVTLILVSAARLLLDRPRPFHDKGAAIIPLAHKGNKGCSFPSRHLTCGGVLALVCMPYLPAVGVSLLILTLILGYTRFAMGWHYLSDLIAGLFLGVAFGSLIYFL